jgi:hypothetical protein
VSVFDLDEKGWADRVADERLRPSAQEESPSVFEGTLRAAGAGIMRGGARVGQFAAMLGAVPAVLAEKSLGTEGILTNDYFRKVDDVANDAVDFWTPDPHGLGAGARAIGGFSEIALPLMATGGNPALLIGTQEMGTATDLTREGVDASTAIGVGAVAGVATAAGFKVPIIGRTLVERMAAGAVGNLLTNTAASAAQHEILGQRGYEQLAENYNPADVEARAVDVLTGLAFGGMYHATAPSKRAGVATTNNAKHFQVDTAPGGIPDVQASSSHQAAMEAGLEQAMRGEPVNVPAEVLDVDFLKRPERELPIPDEYRELDTAREAETVKSEEIAAEEGGYSVAEGELTDEQLAQFQGLRSDVSPAEDLGGTRQGTPAEPGHQNDGRARGEPLKVFRGSSRDLSAPDFELGSLGHATGHPSSGLGVFFTNSASHASNYGKVSEHHLDIQNPKVIPVEDLPGFDKTEDAFAFREALRQQGHDGIVIDASHLGGPVNYVAFGHEQVVKAKRTPISQDARLEDPAKREALDQLRDKIGLTERGGMGITDNDPVKPAALGRTIHVGDPLWMNRPGADTKQGISKASALSALDRVRDGKPLGAAQERFVKYALDELDNVTKDSVDYVNEQAHEVPPEVQAAQEYLMHNDLDIPTGELDADGNVVTRSGREIMAEAEADIVRAEEQGPAYDAAVSCWLMRGPDAR